MKNTALGAGRLHARRRVGALGLYAASRLVRAGATPRLHSHSPSFVFARDTLALDAHVVEPLLVVDARTGKGGTGRALLEVSRDPEIADAARYARRFGSTCCTRLHKRRIVRLCWVARPMFIAVDQVLRDSQRPKTDV